jgi:GDPmannose 4,6-dehydratase
MERAQPDYFINFAGQSFVAASWDLSEQTLSANSQGVLNCLEAIHFVRPTCRFYNAGSSEEFGNVSYEPQDEKHPLKPRSPYGSSKASARHHVKVFRESYGLYAVQGWLFNHEGTRRGKDFVTRKITRGVARILKDIREGDPTGPIVPIELGNLDAKRDWSDAEDMVDAVWRMLNQVKYNTSRVWLGGLPLHPNNITNQIKDYVVSSDENHTIREFIEEAFKAAGAEGFWQGKGIDETYCIVVDRGHNMPSEVAVKINPKFYRPAEIDNLRGNSSLIRKELGWSPKTSFKELVSKMVKNDINLSFLR